MSNYLITGYHGEPHVTPENDRGINASIFGTGRFVLPVGEQFRAEFIGNNTVRMYDGKLMDNGAAAGIPVGEYIDFLIPNAGQGMNRDDHIIFQYSLDPSTLVESGTFTVVQGEEYQLSAGTGTVPELTQSDLLTGEATLDQMALWRVPVSDVTISAPVRVFDVYDRPLSVIGPDNIATRAVTSAKIDTGAIFSDHISSRAVTRAKIADGAVNAEKVDQASLLTLFAPGDAGLGTYPTMSDNTEILESIRNGFWAYNNSNAPLISGNNDTRFAYGISLNYNANHATQIGYCVYTGTRIIRHKHNGTWTNWTTA